MKILITGGCGFLGSNLAKAFQRTHEIHVVDNLYRTGSRQNLEWLQQDGAIEFYQEDVRNGQVVSDILRKIRPDAIFHLAGQVAMTTSIADPRYDFEVNALGTLNVLEGVRAHAPRALIIYSSTNKVYGDLEWTPYQETAARYVAVERLQGFDEKTPLDFHSPYGCSKGAADQYMLDYHRIFGLSTIVFRHSSMYGGRQFATYDQGWIGWFCQKAYETQQKAAGAQFEISGNGKQVRDVLHVEDMIRLYTACLERDPMEIGGNALNIGGGASNSLSLLELFDMLEKELEVKLVYRKLAPRSSDQRVFIADISKAKRLLGWEPQVGKGEGIRKMVQWIKEKEQT